MDPEILDPDPDPAIFAINLQDEQQKTNFLTQFFLLVTS
jgi:hypothetical protein